MPAYLWITVAAAAAFVFWIGWGRGWARSVLYSFARARHVIELTQTEPVPAPEYGSMILAEERQLTPAGYLRGLDGILSSTTTNLARDPDDPYDPEDDEPFRWLPAPTVDPAPWLAQQVPDWREQTAAELSPEALDRCDDCGEPTDEGHHLPEIVLPDAGGWISGPCLDDPGPGDDLPSLASPGPDQPSRWLTEQLEILHAWSARQQRYAEILA